MIEGLRRQARPVPGQVLSNDLRLGAGILDLCSFVAAFAVQPPLGEPPGLARPGPIARFIAWIGRVIFGRRGRPPPVLSLACPIRIERLLSNFDECGTPIEA